jgi:hypothetical protein
MKKIIGSVVVSALLSAGLPSAGVAQPFKIVILPDTQHYSASYPRIFNAQTQWIADNHVAEDIRFVIHLGDITNNNTPAQWLVAQTAMRTLDGVVPYSVVPGNHDTGTGGSSDVRNTDNFNTYFPVGHYSGGSTFGGVYQAGRYENNYHTFSAGGTNWLVLSLEFGPRRPVLAWANEVVAAHPSHRVIVVTHCYMQDDETRNNYNGNVNPHPYTPHGYGVNNDPAGTNDGEDMWRNFIKFHPNITFVLNGHILSDGQGRRVNFSDHGTPVYQMLANYQTGVTGSVNGGNGFLRLLEIDPAAGTVDATTYSPYVNQSKTDWQNHYSFANVPLGPPVASSAPVLFESFDNNNIDGWTVVDEGTVSAPSQWTVSGERARQTSNIHGPSAAATTGRKGTFAYYNKASAMAWSNYGVEIPMTSTDNDGIGLMFYYANPSNYYKVDVDLERNFRKLFKVQGGVETTLATAAGGYTQGTELKLKAQVKNGKVNVSLNGADLFGAVTDPSPLAGGTVAMYCWGSVECHYNSVTVQPIGALLRDDFNDGNVTGWTVVDQGTVSAPSAWSVVRGEVRQTSNIHGPTAAATIGRKGTFLYYNNGGAFSWTNYSFSSVLRSTDNDGVGLVFRYQNANNYYKLDLDNERAFVKLFKVVGGVEATIATAARPGYTVGANTTLKINVSGAQIQVFQDDVNVFGGTITDASLPTGTVGLYSWGQQNAHFDDVIVDPL